MTFDWIAFLERYNIPYTTRAHNLVKGNIGTYCPLCDWSDKSPQAWRLGISPTGKGWNCWSNSEHNGVRPHRLIQAFLKCSWEEAVAIVGEDAPLRPGTDDRSFGDLIGSLLFPKSAPATKREALAFPDSMPQLRPRTVAHGSCVRYLQTRGYNQFEAGEIIKLYDLRFPLSGIFRYRVVFPVWHPEGLVSWTGRTIRKGEELRYRALSADPEKAKKDQMPVAVYPIRDTVWNARAAFLDPCDTLVACEGPLDSARVEYYSYGQARAVCFFGKFISEAQSLMLADIAPLYKRRILLLDPDALIDSTRMRDRLDFLHFEACGLPKGRKDPALLSRKEVQDLLTH